MVWLFVIGIMLVGAVTFLAIAYVDATNRIVQLELDMSYLDARLKAGGRID